MGKEIVFPTQEDPLEMIIGQDNHEIDIAKQHEQARIVMADLEDLFYSAVAKAVGDLFGND